MPGRYIRLCKMCEQVEDGDVLAVAAAMHILGAITWKPSTPRVRTARTCTWAGDDHWLSGGVEQPNEHALQWLDEYLHYQT